MQSAGCHYSMPRLSKRVTYADEQTKQITALARRSGARSSRTASASARHAEDPARLLLVVNGFLVLVALSALISIWFGRTGGG
jgi:hypothetical protein